jgi:hypothetical protein
LVLDGNEVSDGSVCRHRVTDEPQFVYRKSGADEKEHGTDEKERSNSYPQSSGEKSTQLGHYWRAQSIRRNYREMPSIGELALA